MPEQPSLFTATKAPRVTDADVAWLLRALDGKSWCRTKWLQQSFEISDRTFRAIAAASHGRIISGQRGYARTDQASVEDVNHAASWLLTQAAAMTTRAREIQRAMHTRTEAA